MPDKAPLEKDIDQAEQNRRDYAELQEEKTRFLDNQQKRVDNVLSRRRERGERVNGAFAPFIIAKSREDAEALTGRRALVARFTDLTKFIGTDDEDFEIHQEIIAGFRQIQIPIAESSKGSLNLNDVREAVVDIPPSVVGLLPVWFWDPATLRWYQLVFVPVPPVGEVTRIEVIQTAAMAGVTALIWIGERGYLNSLAGATGFITDYNNLLFNAGPFAAAVAGIVFDRINARNLVYINHDDEPSLIAGSRPTNAGFKSGGLWVLLGVLGLAPPPALGPAATLRVKITTQEAV